MFVVPEFMSKEFTMMLAKNGVTHNYTTPNTPAVNGLAERCGGRVSEIMRCMIHGSDCSTKLWPYAVIQAAIVLNALPRRLLNGKTPYELLHNVKFDVNVLRVFGCISFIVDDYANTKLSPRAVECIYIGYDEQSKSHRVFMKNGTTRRSQSVICDEMFTKRSMEDVVHSETKSSVAADTRGSYPHHDSVCAQPPASIAPNSVGQIDRSSLEHIPDLEDTHGHDDNEDHMEPNNGDAE